MPATLRNETPTSIDQRLVGTESCEITLAVRLLIHTMTVGAIQVERAVVLYTADPERLASFYRDTLGFPLEPETDAPPAEFSCELGSVCVSVRGVDDEADARSRIGAMVLSLAVADLDAYLSALRQEGVEAGPVLLPDGARGARLRDPDGNELELVEADSGIEARTAGWFEVVSAPPPRGGN